MGDVPNIPGCTFDFEFALSWDDQCCALARYVRMGRLLCLQINFVP